MSSGVIAFRINPAKQIEYLMICRKDTLGYMDFLRGKFSVYQKYYILNMIKQMTVSEKTRLKSRISNEGSESPNSDDAAFSQTSSISVKDKIRWLIQGVENKEDRYNLLSLIEETETDVQWTEPEWGFPKGRRNSQETDYDCALREFCEETGISLNKLQNIRNIVPFEELFTGSNYKSYRHKYFLMYMGYDETFTPSFQRNEVSQIAWKTFEECIEIIRPYNLEKKRMISHVDYCLKNTLLYYSNGVNI
jgi:8-oxo-dGTP pyrophosphatase MutT (NUDIX family)